MTTTARDIIKSSLRLLGIIGTGETPKEAMETDALEALNFMLDHWTEKRLLGYQQLNETFSAVTGTASYAIGSGATWDTTRPIRIESAFYRSNNIDYYMEPMNNAEYQAITDKVTEGSPTRFFFHPTMSNGAVYLWPVPSQNYTIGLSQIKQVANYSAATDTITLPPGYLIAIKYNLAIELSAEYPEFQLNPTVVQKASETLADIMRTNTELANKVQYEFKQEKNMSGYDVYADVYRH